MLDWSTTSKVWLAVAVCAVFSGVLLLAGVESRPRPSSGVARDEVALAESPPRSSEAPLAMSPAVPSREAARLVSESAAEFSPETAPVVELSRQVMPLDETTAEENEQRGDVIRQLGTSTNPEAVAPLAYAMRNDSDIRNRILAINGLLRAGLAGNPDRAIVDTLAEASRSDDEVIASQARQALAEIERARSRR